MGRVPIADGAVKACLPVKGEKEQRAIVVVQGDVDGSVQRTSHGKPEERRTALGGLLYGLLSTPLP